MTGRRIVAGLTGLVCLVATGPLGYAGEVAAPATEPRGEGSRQVMSGVICDSEAALEIALKVLDGLTPDAYVRFNSYEMDETTLDRLRPEGCDTGTVHGFVRVKTTARVQGETVLVFEMKGRAEYWAKGKEAVGTFYSWLGSGR